MEKFHRTGLDTNQESTRSIMRSVAEGMVRTRRQIHRETVAEIHRLHENLEASFRASAS